MFKVNPYRPGAGLMPTYLAGRDSDIKEMEQKIDRFFASILKWKNEMILFLKLLAVHRHF